jgi:hypothetical protein
MIIRVKELIVQSGFVGLVGSCSDVDSGAEIIVVTKHHSSAFESERLHTSANI